MSREMIDRLKAVRDRLLEETDWHRHKAAQVLRWMIATGQYTPGTALPLDEKLVRLVYENHTVSHSWDEVLDIQQRARQLAAKLPAEPNGRFTLTADFLATALEGFTGPELYPDRTPIDAARRFLSQKERNTFHEGEAYPLRADWIENLLLSWRLSKPRHEREPDALMRQMADWLREHGFPREPAPLTVERVAKIWESWFGILFMPDPHKSLAEKTRARDRMYVYCSLEDWDRALLLANEVERTEGVDLNLLRMEVLCLVRLGRYQEALAKVACWHERAAEERLVASTRKNDVRRLQVEAWIGARMWGEVLDTVETGLVEIESTRQIGDMRYALSSAGVTGRQIAEVHLIGEDFGRVVDAIIEVEPVCTTQQAQARWQAAAEHSLRLGERFLLLFPEGMLNQPTSQENGEDCLRSAGPP